MEDYIIIAILVAIVGLAAWYVIRAKRRGVKCIGCSACSSDPSQNGCGGACTGCQCCVHRAEPDSHQA